MTESPFSNSPFIASPEQPLDGFFDIGFTRFVTNTWISIIWVIVIIAHFIAPLVVLAVTASVVGKDGGSVPLVAFALSLPLVALSLLLSRMSLEVTIVLFRIESNTRATKERLEG